MLTFTNRLVDDTDRLHSVRIFFLAAAYVVACCMEFVYWHFPVAESPLRYLMVIFIASSFNYSEWNRFMIFLAVFLVISLLARRLLVIWTLMAFAYQIASLGISMRRLAVIGAWILGTLIFIQIFAYSFDAFLGYEKEYQKFGRTTYDLGIGNANRMAALVLFFTMLLYICMKDRFRLLFVITAFLLVSAIYLVTGSRTPLAGSFVLIVVALMVWGGVSDKWITLPVALMPVLFFILTFGLASQYGSVHEINELSTGRLWFILLFTQNYTWVEWMIGAPVLIDEPLDSTYLDIICKGGICLASFFCLGFAGSVIKYFREMRMYIPFAVALLTSGLTETFFSNPNSVSVFLWAMAMRFFVARKIDFD